MANTPKELGVTGLDFTLDGTITEEFLPQLAWPYATDTYKEMANNDPTIGAMLFAIEMLIRGVAWKVVPASDSARHREEAELLESIMHDMDKPWSDVVNDILSFLTYGFSIHEPVFKLRRGPLQTSPKTRSKHSDGKFGLRKIPVRSQTSIDKWDLTSEGELKGLWQWATNQGKRVYLPINRVLHFRVNSKRDNPESTSILRTAYRPWFFKKQIEEHEAIGIARDLAGIPVMTAPMSIMTEDASPGEKKFYNELKKIVTNISNNEQSGVVLPSVFDENGNKLVTLDLLTSAGKRQFDTDKIIQRYSSQIAQTVLADFIMLGQTTFGSFALSSNKTKLFASAIGAWLSSISGTLNTQLVPMLAKLNGWDFEDLPMIQAGDLESRDLEIVSNYFSKLAKEGLVRPDQPLEDFLRATAEAPAADEATTRSVETTESISENIVSNATDAGKPTGDAIA